MSYDLKQTQQYLQDLGYEPGPIDGLPGPKTTAALNAFKQTTHLGENSLKLMARKELPWMVEINRVLGLHETRDNRVLTEWLRSDGHALGDPSKLPWCGDAVETAMRLGLPGEVFPPTLESNPYWARNWALFGESCGLVYGAVASFQRPGGGGHVAFLVGVNPNRTLLRIRGGNQANALNDTWIKANRLLATRWPETYRTSKQRLAPVLASSGAPVSNNEV